MKTIFNFLFAFVLFFQISCQKSIVEYSEAIKSCVPVDKPLSGNTGTIVFGVVPTDCILGAQLPEFEEKSMDGKMINRDYFDGKITIINFWHVGCRPCEEEMPALNKLVEKYKGQPVNFLAIGMNTSQNVNSFLVKHPFNFDHIPYAYTLIKDTFQFKWSYPLSLIVNQNLKIISVHHKLDDERINMEVIPVLDKALSKI